MICAFNPAGNTLTPHGAAAHDNRGARRGEDLPGAGERAAADRAVERGAADQRYDRQPSALTPDEGHWYIRDLQSQNNTYVNGVHITERTRVRDGDAIRVGATVFLVGEAPTQKVNTVRLVGEDELDS